MITDDLRNSTIKKGGAHSSPLLPYRHLTFKVEGDYRNDPGPSVYGAMVAQ